MILRTLTACALFTLACHPLQSPSPAAVSQIRDEYALHLESLENAVARMESVARVGSAAPDTALQHAFLAGRVAWKRVEALAEHYAPATARLINGPPIDEAEEDDPSRRVIPAEGFQVIEPMLFPEVAGDSAALLHGIANLRINVARLRSTSLATTFTDANIFDAARAELDRVFSLGLSGFDSPVALHSLPEAEAALGAVQQIMLHYAPEDTTIHQRFRSARASVRSGSFEAFDRLAFLTRELIPLQVALAEVQAERGIRLPETPRAWRDGAATLYEPGAIDASFFAPSGAVSEPAAIELGRALFFESGLSRTGTRSCASCHEPALAFTDGAARSAAFDSHAAPMRNAPTLINAALQLGNFYDTRTTYLEDQAGAVLGNRDEMHDSPAAAAAALGTDYDDRFRAAFGTPGIDEKRVRFALAAYIRSLIRLDAPFDRFVRGDSTAMSADARRGFNLFMGKARCGSCHFAPLFSGAVPPLYGRTEVEVLGVPAAPGARGVIDPDSGRYLIARNPLHLHAFRTPGLRNVALTAPYMHNGVYRTLEEVMDFYNGGGGDALGISLSNQTLPFDSLRLTVPEMDAVIVFLASLTDTTGMGVARPSR